MPVSGIKDWAVDPQTLVTLKETGKMVAVSGTGCFVGGILFGPAGVGVGGVLFGISFYIIDKDAFGSAAYSLYQFAWLGTPPERPPTASQS